jgi:hypothetical protein
MPHSMILRGELVAGRTWRDVKSVALVVTPAMGAVVGIAPFWTM